MIMGFSLHLFLLPRNIYWVHYSQVFLLSILVLSKMNKKVPFLRKFMTQVGEKAVAK